MPHDNPLATTPIRREAEENALALERVREALRGLRFGQITLVVQDGVVVQIERTEKLRISRK